MSCAPELTIATRSQVLLVSLPSSTASRSKWHRVVLFGESYRDAHRLDPDRTKPSTKSRRKHA